MQLRTSFSIIKTLTKMPGKNKKMLINPSEVISVGQNIKNLLEEISSKLDAKFKSDIVNPSVIKDIMSLYRDICTEFLTLSNKLMKSTKS
jgi:hypothetical protein